MNWAQARIGRTERELMSASLDERIGQDHGIRMLDALLRELDWTEWEASYQRDGAGRPPIHPQQMCAVILYGLIKRVRSLRELEEATRVRIDFQWLLEGRVVDHTTFGTFKKRFDGRIQELFKQISRKAADLRGATIEEVVVDGSRLRADSDRHGARTARGLEKRLEKLEERLSSDLEKLAEEEFGGGQPVAFEAVVTAAPHDGPILRMGRYSLAQVGSAFQLTAPAADGVRSGRFGELRLFAGGPASMFPSTATVEADSSLASGEKTDYRASLSDFSLEGVLPAKQFELLRSLSSD